MSDYEENRADTGTQDIPLQWKRWFREDRLHSQNWREEAREDYDFVAGRQWSEDDKATLRDELRPVITFNRVGVMIDAVSGNEINARQEVRYLPREQGDAQVNELYTEAARWFDDESDAEDEDSDAFIDTVICGMGWTETRLDFDDDPDGEPVTERIDPLEMYWDSSCGRSNLKNARRLWRVKEMSYEDARDEFPDAERSDLDAGSWISDVAGGVNVERPDEYYENESEFEDDEARKTCRVIHLQFWDYEPFYRVLNPLTGQIEELDEDDFKAAEQNVKALSGGAIKLKHVKQRRKVYRQAFIGRKLLKQGPSPCREHFTWNCITGKRDRNKRTWYGLVRAMKDPARWGNKWLSQLLHILNSNSSGGVLFESGAFANQRQAEQDWARPDAMIELKSGALTNNKIQEKGQAQFPVGFQQLTEMAVSAVRDVTGINLELLGMREANQAGVLEYQRRQAGLSVLAPLFNSLRRYRKGRGRVLLYFIDNYLADGRLVRIIGQDREKYVPLLKQSNAKYDIIVDDAPTSPNQKELVWASMTQLLPGIKDIVPPKVLLELLEYSPLPASVVAKIKQVVSEPDPAQKQKHQMAAQDALLELAKKQAEVGKIQSETAENQAQADRETAETELARTQPLNEARLVI